MRSILNFILALLLGFIAGMLAERQYLQNYPSELYSLNCADYYYTSVWRDSQCGKFPYWDPQTHKVVTR